MGWQPVSSCRLPRAAGMFEMAAREPRTAQCLWVVLLLQPQVVAESSRIDAPPISPWSSMRTLPLVTNPCCNSIPIALNQPHAPASVMGCQPKRSTRPCRICWISAYPARSMVPAFIASFSCSVPILQWQRTSVSVTSHQHVEKCGRLDTRGQHHRVRLERQLLVPRANPAMQTSSFSLICTPWRLLRTRTP